MGRMIELALLDGRQYRTDQACGDVTLSLEPPCAEVNDAARTMLGDVQETWLYDTLDASTSTWNVIGNQTVFADATFTQPFSTTTSGPLRPSIAWSPMFRVPTTR